MGSVHRRSDIYSLGVTLCELLTLRPMYEADEQTPTPELMRRIQYAEPESPRRYNPRVSRDLAAVLLKCLEKDPRRRYATAAELADDLGRLLAREPVQAHPRQQTLLSFKSFCLYYRTACDASDRKARRVGPTPVRGGRSMLSVVILRVELAPASSRLPFTGHSPTSRIRTMRA